MYNKRDLETNLKITGISNARLPCISVGINVINVDIPSLYGLIDEQFKDIAGRSNKEFLIMK
jgi:hypothetical protein